MNQWQPIATAPRDREVLFWIVPKLPEEAFVDTSGNPIFSTHAPYLHRGKLGMWSSLSKATHWHELPDPPPGEAGRADPPASPANPQEHDG